MVFLKDFKLLNDIDEYNMLREKMNIYNSMYPFQIFPMKEFERIEFEPITIFYGGNGSGKTTLLNIIADSLNSSRRSNERRGDLFDKYVRYCRSQCEFYNSFECKSIKYISSDDVFDYLLDIRAINSGVNRRKEDLVHEYVENRYSSTERYNTNLNQYDDIKNKLDSYRMTASKYVRTRLRNNNIMAK